jgi:hypothetical protein
VNLSGRYVMARVYERLPTYRKQMDKEGYYVFAEYKVRGETVSRKVG